MFLVLNLNTMKQRKLLELNYSRRGNSKTFLLKEARRFYESGSAAVDSFENECRGAIWKYWKKTFSSRTFYEEERFSFGRNRSHALFWGEDWQMDGRYRVSLGFQKRDLCPLERSIPWRKTLFFFFLFTKTEIISLSPETLHFLLSTYT